MDLNGVGEKTINKVYKEFKTLKNFHDIDSFSASRKLSMPEKKVRSMQRYLKDFMFK